MSKTYLGIDVHKRHCVFTEIDLKGNVLRRERFENSFEGVSDIIGFYIPELSWY
jgi:predicted NBD/HSP70 family sugar kinase